MAKVQKKLEAQVMRRRGRSIKDIAATLSVSRGSVSVWCREITLSSSQKHNLTLKQIQAGNIGRLKGAEVNRQKRLEIINLEALKARKRVASLSKRDLLMLGIGLYWGEGVKSRSGQASLVNSDPTLLLIGKRWFEECLSVAREDFRPYIYISLLHESRADTIIAYWAKLLSIPQSQFHTPIIIKQKPKKRYENHEDYYGVVALRVRKSSTLKYYIQGLISAVSN